MRGLWVMKTGWRPQWRRPHFNLGDFFFYYLYYLKSKHNDSVLAEASHIDLVCYERVWMCVLVRLCVWVKEHISSFLQRFKQVAYKKVKEPEFTFAIFFLCIIIVTGAVNRWFLWLINTRRERLIPMDTEKKPWSFYPLFPSSSTLIICSNFLTSIH